MRRWLRSRRVRRTGVNSSRAASNRFRSLTRGTGWRLTCKAWAMPAMSCSRPPRRLSMLLVMAALVFPDWLLGQRVSFGFVGGTNITRDFPISRTLYEDPAYPAGLTTFDLFSNTHAFVAGFSTEVQI